VRSTKALKHACDRLLTLAGLPLFLPPFLSIALAIWVESRWRGERGASIFFREERYSQNRPFTMRKFRILRQAVLDARRAAGETTVKGAERDPANLTRVGALLVRFYLDEMPQYFHVLSGRMSLVGPRPVWPHDAVRRDYFAPYRVKAGLAGTFQLAKGEGDIFDLDKVYLENYARRGALSLLLYDAGVILRTLRKMTRGEGL
jgi:lipopolysaccharide/colanic/teichoic acid biosynthesis glycosyltransferase